MRMDAEKRSSKGGFFQLFDWNVKSRKKFLNKSEFSEGTNQGNEEVANSKTLHPLFLEKHENVPGPRSTRTSDYNYASSVTSDEGCGTKAPGVVARLMGLDSLPTSTFSEPCPIPFHESSFVREISSQKGSLNFQIQNHIINSLPNDQITRNLVESRLPTVQSRPIDRFQTETIPSRSAKSIPITRNRLLSPIKSPGFISTNNVTYLMEAASKIIDPGPPSTTNGKMARVRSSSVPLRIPNLKEKMEVAPRAYGSPEASWRSKEPFSLHNIRKNLNESGDAQLYNASVSSRKDSSESFKNKGKSVSHAVQAKVNVQRKEGSAASGSTSSVNQKESSEVKLDLYNKSQTSMQKKVQKRSSMCRTSGVLKQNNQKQNCVAHNQKVASKASVSNQKDRKVSSGKGPVRPTKVSNKVVNSTNESRKMNYVAQDTGNEPLPSKTKSPENKQSIHRDVPFEESIDKNVSISTTERSVKCNVSNDGCLNWDVVDRKSSLDVVSFTFTSPIKRSAPVFQTSGEFMKRNALFCVDSCDDSCPLDIKSPSPSLRLNVNGGDCLSALLEQKLKEVAFRVESSNCNLVNDGSASCSAFSLQDSQSTFNITNTTTMESCNQLYLHEDKPGNSYDANCASVDCLWLKAKQKMQGLEVIQAQSTSSDDSDYGDLHYRVHSSISNHEAFSSDRSYASSEGKSGSVANGPQRSLFAAACIDSVFATDRQPVEVETELSDSASSTSAACISGKNSSTPFSLTDFKKFSKWELDYIRKVLSNSDLCVKDFVFGWIHMASPYVFDQLENLLTECDGNAEEYFNLGRKVLFDCVEECLELRDEQLFRGSCKSWSTWEILFQQKGCLANELYKEISSWTSMGALMVDELVHRDMSSRHGKWVEFEDEAFEEGVEIEKGMLTSLVEELVVDLLI